jgi:hypothetical protein
VAPLESLQLCPDALHAAHHLVGNSTALATPLSDNANTALDRIEIPEDAIQQISELLTPGSSFIISDYGISSETGPYTDFIVLTR